jgi:hypothetical protein
MATPQDSMLAGLFTTPEQYQQQRQAVQRAQAIQMASLDPFQQGQANIQMGINRIADVGAGALGIQDPQLQAVSTIRELSNKYDTNTSGGVAGLATELQQRGMQQQAFQLGQRALEMRKLEAEAQAKTAERLTPEQKNATAMADASGAERGSTAWTEAYKSNLAQLTAKDIRTSDQKNFTEAVKGGYKGNFNQWLLEQNKSKGTNISSQVKLPTDINALAAGYEKAIEGDVSVKNLAFNAKGLINQAAVSNNPSAWEAARTQVAKAVGEGKLSNEDIARTGVDPTLIGGVRDWIEKKVVGVPDVNTQKALFVVASYLEKNASNRIAEKRNNRIAMARQVNPDVDAAAMFPDYSNTVQTTSGAGGGGGGKIVDFKDFNKKAP